MLRGRSLRLSTSRSTPQVHSSSGGTASSSRDNKTLLLEKWNAQLSNVFASLTSPSAPPQLTTVSSSQHSPPKKAGKVTQTKSQTQQQLSKTKISNALSSFLKSMSPAHTTAKTSPPKSGLTVAVEPLLGAFVSGVMLSVSSISVTSLVASEASAYGGPLWSHLNANELVASVAVVDEFVNPAASSLAVMIAAVLEESVGSPETRTGAVVDEMRRAFSAVLQETLVDLPLALDVPRPPKCCQLNVLIGLLQVVRMLHRWIQQHFTQRAAAASTTSTPSWFVALVTSSSSQDSTETLLEQVVVNLEELLLEELSSTRRLRSTLQMSVVYSSALTVVFMSPYLDQLQHPTPMAKAPSTAASVQVQLRCAKRFVDQYEAAFIAARVSITSGSEIAAWLDSAALLLAVYAQQGVSPPLKKNNTATEVEFEAALQRCILTVMSTDSTTLTTLALLEERSQQCGPNDDSTTTTTSSNEHASDSAVLARVRPKRTLFGKADKNTNTNNVEETATSRDASHSQQQTLSQLISDVLAPGINSSKTTTGGISSSLSSQPVAVVATSRFTRRLGAVSNSNGRSDTGTTTASPSSSSSVTQGSPITTMIWRSPNTSIRNELSKLLEKPSKLMMFRVDTICVLLASAVDALWVSLDSHVPSMSNERRAAVHHIASEVEHVVCFLMEALVQHVKFRDDDASMPLRRTIECVCESLTWVHDGGDGFARRLRQAVALNSPFAYTSNVPAVIPLHLLGGGGRGSTEEEGVPAATAADLQSAAKGRAAPRRPMAALLFQRNNAARAIRYSVKSPLLQRSGVLEAKAILPVLKADMSDMFTPDGGAMSTPTELKAAFLTCVIRYTAQVLSSPVRLCDSEAEMATLHQQSIDLARMAMEILASADEILAHAASRQLFNAVSTLDRRRDVVGTKKAKQSDGEFSELARRLFHKAAVVWIHVALAGLDAHATTISRQNAGPSSAFKDHHLWMCMSVAETMSSLRLKPAELFEAQPLAVPVLRYCCRILSGLPQLAPESSPLASLPVEQQNALAESIASTLMPSTGVTVDAAAAARERALLLMHRLVANASGFVFHRSAFVERCSVQVQRLQTRRRQLILRFLLSENNDVLFQSGRGSLASLPEFLSPPSHSPPSTSSTGSIGGDSAASSSSAIVTTAPASPAVQRSFLADEDLFNTLPNLFATCAADVFPIFAMVAAVIQQWRGEVAVAESVQRVAERDAASVFVILCQGAAFQPWTFLSRAFALERNVVQKLNWSTSQPLLQELPRWRTQAFLTLFSKADPIPVKKHFEFAELVLHLEDLICSSTPVNLLGIMRDSSRSRIDMKVSSNPRLLRAHFYGVKQVVLQLGKFERDLNEMFCAPSPAALPSSSKEETIDEDDIMMRVLSTTPKGATALPTGKRSPHEEDHDDEPQQQQRSIHSSSYRILHALYMESLVATFDLVIDSLRTHAFQKTLEEPMRLLLNHGVVSCCHLLQRLVSGRGSFGEWKNASQQHMSTVTMTTTTTPSESLEGLLVFVSATISTFLATLLTSDARHSYLEDVTRTVVHTTLSELHRYVSTTLAPSSSSSSSSSSKKKLPAKDIKNSKDSKDDTTTTPKRPTTEGDKEHVAIVEVMLRLATTASPNLRRHMGFVHHREDVTLASIFESLVSMSLSVSLVRQSPYPGIIVHALLTKVQSELLSFDASGSGSGGEPKIATLNGLRAVGGGDKGRRQADAIEFIKQRRRMETVPQNVLLSFHTELQAMEERMVEDLNIARKERSLLANKVNVSCSSSSDSGSPSEALAVAATPPSSSSPPSPSTTTGSNTTTHTTLTVEEKFRSEDGSVGFETQLASISVDAQYLENKVRTLETLTKMRFSFSKVLLDRIAAVCSPRQQESLSAAAAAKLQQKKRRGGSVLVDEEEDVLMASIQTDPISTSANDTDTSAPTAPENQARWCSGPDVTIELSIDRISSLFASALKRFRGTSTHARRNTIAAELLLEFDAMVEQYGFVELSNTNPAKVAICLKLIRMAKRLAPECASLCEKIAKQLRTNITEPTADASQQLLKAVTKFHAQQMNAQQMDPVSYVSQVASGGMRMKGDQTRFQAEDNLTVMEALATRGGGAVDGTATTTAAAVVVVDDASERAVLKAIQEYEVSQQQRQRGSATTGMDDVSKKSCLPFVVVLSLLNELRRLDESPGCGALVQEVVTHVVRVYVYPYPRIGSRASILEAAKLFPAEWLPEVDAFLTKSVAHVTAASQFIRVHGSQLDSKQLLSLQVQRNAALLIAILSRSVVCLSKHRMMGNFLEDSREELNLLQGFGGGGGGGRPNRSLNRLEGRREAARLRVKHLSDPFRIRDNLLQSAAIATQQWLTKTILHGDAMTLMVPVGTGGNTIAALCAREVRSIAGRAVLETALMLCNEPAALRKLVVAPLSVFVTVPRTPRLIAAATAASSSVSGSDSSAAAGGATDVDAATVDVNELPFHVQSPTLLDVFGQTMLLEVLPKIAESCSPNFTATVASVLDVRLLSHRDQVPLSLIVKSACTLVTCTLRRSQLLLSCLFHICYYINRHADLRDESSTMVQGGGGGGRGRQGESLNGSTKDNTLTAEELAMLVAVLLREDLRLPPDVLAQTIQHIFRRRRDIFGDPPMLQDQTLLSLTGDAARAERRKASAAASIAVASRVTRSRQFAVDSDKASSHQTQQHPTDEQDDEGFDIHSEQSATDQAASSQLHEAFHMYASDGVDLRSTETHGAALAALNFNVEQLMVLMASYATRLRLRGSLRREGLGLIRGAMQERQERLATGRATSPSSNADLTLHFSDPLHLGISVIHAEFALKKIIHSAARKTGVVQAPHSLADIIEVLHEVEDKWRDEGKRDGMLNATLHVLVEWALLRVEDAGCDGVEDRNQFVTPSDRLYGDMTLRNLKRWRKNKERRQKNALLQQQQRQWRVKVKSSASPSSSLSSNNNNNNNTSTTGDAAGPASPSSPNVMRKQRHHSSSVIV